MEIVRRQDAEGKTSEFAKACSERLREMSVPVRTTCKHTLENVCKSAQRKTLEALKIKGTEKGVLFIKKGTSFSIVL